MKALRFLAGCVCITGMLLVGTNATSGAQTSHNEPPGHAHVGVAPTATDGNVARLLATTKAAAAGFRDRRAAVAAGYRRIGPDVPSMGEHWINPRYVVADTFDVTEPALLTYIKVEGRPVLTGVVYAAPLAFGQSPPAIFGRNAVWHEHNGTLDEEALLPDHHTAPSAANGMRLSILHAWLWSPNPQGMFATENWTIPFLRLALVPPQTFPESAARAVSLLSGSEYYLNLAGAGSSPTIEPILIGCAARADRITKRALESDRILTRNEVETLSLAWTESVLAIAKVSGKDVAKRLNGGRMP